MTDTECLEERLFRQINEAQPFIDDFCKKYGSSLLCFTITMENGSIEPAYIFDDGLGYYTIEGIKASL